MRGEYSFQFCMALLGWCFVWPLASAHGLQPLEDGMLADVSGRGGVSFATSLNQAIGSIQYGTYDTLGNPATLAQNNYSLSGTFLATFDVRQGAIGKPDFLDWALPAIATTKPLQLGYDLAITAGGNTLGTGVTFQNVVLAGSGMQLTTAATGGIAFGLAPYVAIDHVLLQPSRGNANGQMDISGVTLGGTASGTPWVLADLTNQTGEFHVLSPGGGDQLQWTINWPDSAPLTPGASSGSLQINNITFATPGGPVDIGSSSIGSMQIQYLNVKFRP